MHLRHRRAGTSARLVVAPRRPRTSIGITAALVITSAGVVVAVAATPAAASANRAPVAIDEAFVGDVDAVMAGNLKVNDFDPDGARDGLTFSPVSVPLRGTLSLNNAGTFSYTPDAGYVGLDSFKYKLCDPAGACSRVATTTFGPGVPLVAADDIAFTPGTPVIIAALANDASLSGGARVVANGPATHGSVALNPDGTLTYTPAARFTGTDTFRYVIDDYSGADSVSANVTVTVTNGPPVAHDDAVSTPTSTPVTVDVLANDTDPNSDPLTIVTGSVTTPVDGAGHATGTAVIDSGAVLYTPPAGFCGSVTFDYQITDGDDTDTETHTATVTVTVANAPPVAADDDSAWTPTNTPVTVDVLANDTDPNIPGTTQTLTVTDAHDTDATGATVVVNADSTITVTPATGYKGWLTLSYTVSDGAGGFDDTPRLRVYVTNAAPSAVADSATTPYLTPITIDVRHNDSDLNGEPITLVAGSVTTPVDAGGHPRGTAVIDSDQVRYTPPAGFSGTVTFSYIVEDPMRDAASATVTVDVGNAPPVTHDDTATTPTNTPVTVDVLANDTDSNVGPTAQALVTSGLTTDHGATVVSNADHTLTVTPATGYKGPITVTYTVSDGAGGTDTGELVVTVRNAPPVAHDDAATTPYGTAVSIPMLDDDTDLNGDAIAVVAGSATPPVTSGGATRGTVTVASGVATYTPPSGFSGVVTFEYAITDGTDTGTGTGTVTVTVGNAPPVAAPDTAATKPGTPITIDVTGNDGDPDGGTLAITGFTQPTSGSVTLVTGRLVYTPAPGFSGTVTFSYTATDGQGGTTTGTVTVTVAAATPTSGGSGGASLARTGTEIGLTAALAVLLLGGGLALVVAARRRRT